MKQINDVYKKYDSGSIDARQMSHMLNRSLDLDISTIRELNAFGRSKDKSYRHFLRVKDIKIDN